MDDNLTPAEYSEDKLTEKELQELEAIKKQIDSLDSNTVIQLGTGVQSGISEFADKILSEVKTGNTDYVGKALNNLMLKIREMRVDDLSGESGGFLSKIPFIGSLIDKTKQFLTKYENVSTQIVKIVDELERAKVQLLKDTDMLNSFYDGNIEYFRNLNLYIMAGEEKLEEFQKTKLPEMKTKAESSGDAVETQKFKDMFQLAARLEKKIHDLKLSKTVSLQTGPQIRLIQHHNQELAEKIQSSILNTIPLWKNQMVIAITLLRQTQLAGLQKEVSDTTKMLLEKNAEMLKVSSIEIAKEAEKGIVDIESLKKVNADLITTIDETIRLHHAGKVRRAEAEQELIQLEKELKDKLLEVRDLPPEDKN